MGLFGSSDYLPHRGGSSVAAAMEAQAALDASDGSDGDFTFSGTTNPLTRTVYYRNVTFGADARVQAAGYEFNAQRIVGVQGSPGVIENVGNAGAAGGAAGGATTGTYATGIAGGAGGTAAGSAGGNATALVPAVGKAALTDEYKAGAGGAGSGGAGGAAGTVTILNTAARDIGRGGSKRLLGQLLGAGALSTNTAGAGGGGGGGDGTAGGGGGAGGTNIGVNAGYIADMIIRSKGGAGGTPAAGNRGGGGGGGGGRARGNFGTDIRVQYDVSGGVGGSPSGTGAAGADGSVGIVEHTSYTSTGRSKIVLIGDSITDNTYRGPTSHFTLGGPRLVRNQAVTGNTLNQQLTAWQANTARGQPLALVQGVLIHCGTNDLRALDSAAQCLTDLNALITDIATNNPGIPIVVCRVSPAKAHYDTIDVAIFARWQTFNASIDALNNTTVGSSLITTTSETDTLLNDGSGNLAVASNSGDDLHPNNAGELLLAGAYNTALVARGL